MEKALDEAALSPQEIETVLLIGGTAKIPLLKREMIARFGPRAKKSGGTDLRRVSMERAEEFVQLFNKVQDSLFMLTGRPRTTPFWQLVEAAALLNTAVRSNSDRLKKFAMLRNAIVHDGEYPPYIVANPSGDALATFRLIAVQILELQLLIPTFAAEVRCFSPTDSLVETLRHMRIRDFFQIVLRDVIGALRLITVEGITKWLAAQVETFPTGMADTVLADVLTHEHPGSFLIMESDRTVFDAEDAFRNSIHHD